MCSGSAGTRAGDGMANFHLFPKEKVVGIFRGFSQGGLEFHADIVLPYRSEFQSIPMHGQFLLVQLAHQEEAVLGRITAMHSDGRLASGEGEDYSVRAVQESRVVPDDLRDQYLKYRVSIRVLGVVRRTNGDLVFAASHRRLPHLGSPVAFPADDVLEWIAGHREPGAELGFLALGEYVYSGGDKRLKPPAWMQVVNPCVIPKFDITKLISRRTFIFARAGFGKSNLTKLLFSNLYKGSPTVPKRNGLQVPVGTVIFDPDGEYFWPDDKGRPGLCDVPELEDKIVLFTRRRGPSAFYQSFVAGDIKLDIRRLRPADVISIALSPEKQDQQNVRKLKGLSQGNWSTLVDLIADKGNQADLEDVKELLHLDPNQSEAEATAARSNMTSIVRMLHDRSSQMMDMLLESLRNGKLCIVDVSQLRGGPALILSGLILQKIFDTNQQEFTEAHPKTIPTIAVVEEAQSVLGGAAGSGGEGPYIAWVKEGRKYDLGAVLITQQPGSISSDILSQGDNWFMFHLLAAADLGAARKANAHFSDDVLSALLNEPLQGHGVFWSSVGNRQYPIPLRVLSFEDSCTPRDPGNKLPAGKTFAAKLRSQFEQQVKEVVRLAPPPVAAPADVEHEPEHEGEGEAAPEPGEQVNQPIDILEAYSRKAIAALDADPEFQGKWAAKGAAPWMAFQKALERNLPATMSDRADRAYHLVPRALDEKYGKDNWKKEKRPRAGGGGETTWIVFPV